MDLKNPSTTWWTMVQNPEGQILRGKWLLWLHSDRGSQFWRVAQSKTSFLMGSHF